MTAKLVIFDFDGTLADTCATILATYQSAISELHMAPRTDAECRATIGLPLRKGFAQLYPDADDAALDRFTATYRRIFAASKERLRPELFPGVREMLGALREMGMTMAIASSRSEVSLTEFCRDNGISDYFSLMLGGDSVCNAKPDPEPVLTTLRRLGFECGETIVVGDMPVDIAMGKGAGCQTVGVTYGNATKGELIDAGADHVVDSAADIVRIADGSCDTIWRQMKSGDTYEALHPYLISRLEITREKLWEYNSLRPSETARQEEILRGLLGRCGKQFHFNQPFRCDYGENISIGENFFANFNLTILDEAEVTFGDNVFIGPNVSIYTACHPIEPGERNTSVEWSEPVSVGNNVWIGGSVTILPGVTIGDNCTIGAGSVVVKDIPANSVAAGNPCRVKKTLD